MGMGMEMGMQMRRMGMQMRMGMEMGTGISLLPSDEVHIRDIVIKVIKASSPGVQRAP